MTDRRQRAEQLWSRHVEYPPSEFDGYDRERVGWLIAFARDIEAATFQRVQDRYMEGCMDAQMKMLIENALRDASVALEMERAGEIDDCGYVAALQGIKMNLERVIDKYS